MCDKTRREKIIEALEFFKETPSSLSEQFENIDEQTILKDIEHIKKSLKNNKTKTLIAIPPECKNCGFNDFDNIINIPSKCPNCKSERISEPVFHIIED